jgi:transposase
MTIQRAFKVRIYPIPEQQVFLNKTLGCCRFLYNQMLAERIQAYEQLKDDKQALYTHKYKTERAYKQEYEFLKEADAVALQQVRRNLDAAYNNFYQSLSGVRNGERVGFPRFKAKHKHNDSYRTGMAIKVNLEEQTIKLPKVARPLWTWGRWLSEREVKLPWGAREREEAEILGSKSSYRPKPTPLGVGLLTSPLLTPPAQIG